MGSLQFISFHKLINQSRERLGWKIFFLCLSITLGSREISARELNKISDDESEFPGPGSAIDTFSSSEPAADLSYGNIKPTHSKVLRDLQGGNIEIYPAPFGLEEKEPIPHSIPFGNREPVMNIKEILKEDCVEAETENDFMYCFEYGDLKMRGNNPGDGTGEWTLISGAAEFEDPSDPETRVYNIAPGENVFKWTIYPSDGCPVTSDLLTITYGYSDPPLILTPDEICEGESIILSVEHPERYDVVYWWKGLTQIGMGDLFEIPNADPSMYGLYSADMIDIYGCEHSADKEITVTLREIADAGSDVLYCSSEQNYTMQANTPINGTGKWSVFQGSAVFSDDTDPHASVSQLAYGENKLVWTVTPAGVCPAVRDTMLIYRSYPAPEVLGPESLCEGEDLTLTLDHAEDYSSIEWHSYPEGKVATGGVLFMPDVPAGLYGSFTIYITDHHGCEKEIYRSVDIHPVDPADAGEDQIIAAGASAYLEGNYSESADGYWTLLSGSAHIEDPYDAYTEVTDLGPGANVFVWTLVSVYGCADQRDTVTILVEGTPVISGAFEICAGADILLWVNNNRDYSSFEWRNPDNVIVSVDSILRIENADAEMAGEYSLKVTDLSGFSQTVEFQIEIEPVVEADAGPDLLICQNATIFLEAEIPVNGTGKWSVFQGSAVFSDDTDPHASVSQLAYGENKLVWTVTPAGVCPVVRDTMLIYRSYPAPEVLGPESLCEGEDLTLTLDHAQDYTSIEWHSYPEGKVATGGVLFMPDVPAGLYGSFTIYITDHHGCEKEIYRSVDIHPVDPADAGEDQIIAPGASAYLEGNYSESADGYWTLLSGSAHIEDPYDAYTEVTDLGPGANVFVWTLVSVYGCADQKDTVTVLVEGTPVISGAFEICAGADILLWVNNNRDYSSFEWRNPDNVIVSVDSILRIENADAEMAGEYSLKVTGLSGFSQTVEFQIEIEPVVEAYAGQDDTVCDDDFYQMEADFLPDFASGLWRRISGSGDIDDASDPHTMVRNLEPGENIFEWTLASGSGCSTARDTVVVRVGFPAPDIISNDPICEGEVLILKLEHPELYSSIVWSYDGSYRGTGDSLVLKDLPADIDGHYEVYVIGVDGCEQESFHRPVIYPVYTSNGTFRDTLCYEDSYELIGNPLNYYIFGEWRLISGSGDMDDVTDPYTMVRNLEPGENIFEWTVTSEGGCSTIRDTVVLQVGYSDPAILATGAYCEGETLVLSVEHPERYEETYWYYHLEPGLEFLGRSDDLILSDITADMSGTYDADMIDVYGCEQAADILITISPRPVADAGSDFTLCLLDYHFMQAADPGSDAIGKWRLISGSADISNDEDPRTRISNLGHGPNVFEWTVTPVSGLCPVQKDTVVIAFAFEAPDIVADTLICEGETIHLGLSRTDVYNEIEWYDKDDNFLGTNESIEIAGVTADMSGTYYVLLRDSFWCGLSSYIDIHISTPPGAAAGKDVTLCFDEDYQMQADSLEEFTSGQWRLISGHGDLDEVSDPQTLVRNLAPGKNVFEWTVSSHAGCPSTRDTMVISMGYPAPNIITNAPVCEGESLTMSVDHPENFSTFEWLFYFNGSITGIENSVVIPDVTVDREGWYILEARDLNGCVHYGSVEINIYPRTTADAGPDQVLPFGDLVQLTGNLPQYGSGYWTQISGSGTIENPSDPRTIVSNIPPGIHVFVWTIASSYDCPDSRDTVTISVQAPPPSVSGSNLHCEGNTIFLQINHPEHYSSVEWRNPEGVLLSSQSSLLINEATPEMTGTYTLTVTDVLGHSHQLTQWIEVRPLEVAVAGEDQLLCETSSAILSGNTPVDGMGVWTFLSGSGIIENPGYAQTRVTNLGSGENILVWSIESFLNCAVSRDTLTIRVSGAGPEIRSNAPLCAGMDLELSVTRPEDYVKYSWYGPDNRLLGHGPALMISGIGAEFSGLFRIETEDEWGCVQSGSTEIVIVEPEPAFAGEDKTICGSDQWRMEAILPDSSLGRWSLLSGEGKIEEPENPQTLITRSAPGTDVWIWTVTSLYYCMETSDTVTITVGYPAPKLSSNTPICEGGTLELAVEDFSNLEGVQWFNSEKELLGEDFIFYLPEANERHSGSYFARSTDEYGCEHLDSVEVTIVIPDPAFGGNDRSVCDTGNVFLDATLRAGNTGVWSVWEGDGVLEDPSDPKSKFTNISPEKNAVLIWRETNAFGCVDADTVLLDYQNPSPPAYAGEDQVVCSSDSMIQLGALSPAYGGGEWEVRSGTGQLSDPFDSHTTLIRFIPDSSGELVLRWRINDECHTGLASAEDIVRIRVDQPSGPATILSSDIDVCEADQIELHAEENLIGTGNWSVLSGPGIIEDVSSGSTNISSLEPGQKSVVQWTVTNGVCPSESSTMKIWNGTTPDLAVAGPDLQLCDTALAVLGATPVTVGEGLWRIHEGPGTLLDPGDPGTLIYDLVPGSETFLIWEVRSGSCPGHSDSLFIRNDALPSVAMVGEDRELCDEMWVALGVDAPETGTGVWEIIEGAGDIISNGGIDTFLFKEMNQPARLVYSVTNGICPVSADTLQLIGYSLPDPAVAGEDFLTCENQVELRAHPVSSGTGEWEITRGEGRLSDPTAPVTRLTEMSRRDSIALTWRVSNGVCPENIDHLFVATGAELLDPQAGEDLNICGADQLLLHAQPASGGASGRWTIASGPGTVHAAGDANSLISDLIPGESTLLVWTLSEASCPEVSDTLLIRNLDGEEIEANFLINEIACLGFELAGIDVSAPKEAEVDFRWLIDGEFFSDERDPFIVFYEPGLHQIQLEIGLGECAALSPLKEVEIYNCLIGEKDSLSMDELNQITVYPNPTSGPVQIEIDQVDEESEILVYADDGRLVYSQKVFGKSISKELILENPGLYFVQILNSKFQKVYKIVKL